MNGITSRDEEQQLVAKRWDIPHLVKWILLILLFGLLAAEIRAGEFNNLAEGFSSCVWLILLLKVLLIIGLILLMKIQRSLK